MKLWQALTAAALIWAAVFLPALGVQELKGEEGRRVLPGKNMLMHGEWAVPHVGGKVYSRKPPLMNWLAAASFEMTGAQNEWAARLPSVAAVCAMALCIVAAGSVWMKGASISFMAAVFAMTNIAMLEKGRLAELEPLYVGLTGIAFALWSKFFMEEKSPWLTWTLPWLFLGLGLLTKGPPHLLFFYGPVIGILVVGKRWKLLLHPAHAVGVCLMLAVALPWVFINRARAMELSPEGASPGAVWAEQMGNRLDFGSGGILSWILTPFEALSNYFPWVILLLFLWWRISQWKWNVSPILELKLDRTTRREWMRGAAWGIAISFLIVALIPQSSARYTHPAIVPASMLLAVMVSQLAPGHAIFDRVSVIWKGANRFVLVAWGIALLLVPPITLFWGNWIFPVVWFAVGCVVCGAAVFVGWRLSQQESLVFQTGASACALAAGIQLFSIAVLPAVVEEDNVRPVGQAIAGSLPESARLCVLDPGFQPFLFYLAPPYDVVAKSGDVPVQATHLLLSQSVYDKSVEKPLMRKNSFREVFRIGDKDGKEWILLEIERPGVGGALPLGAE